MTDEPTTRARELLRELGTDGYSARARARAQRRRSPWNLVLIPLAIGGVGATWYAFLVLLAAVRNLVVPEHSATLGELSRCEGMFPIVFFVSSFVAAIPVGLVLGNSLAWCVASARRTFEKEAQGVWHASYSDVQRDLLVIAVYSVPPALLLAFGGGVLMRCSHG